MDKFICGPFEYNCNWSYDEITSKRYHLARAYTKKVSQPFIFVNLDHVFALAKPDLMDLQFGIVLLQFDKQSLVVSVLVQPLEDMGGGLNIHQFQGW